MCLLVQPSRRRLMNKVPFCLIHYNVGGAKEKKKEDRKNDTCPVSSANVRKNDERKRGLIKRAASSATAAIPHVARVAAASSKVGAAARAFCSLSAHFAGSARWVPLAPAPFSAHVAREEELVVPATNLAFVEANSLFAPRKKLGSFVKLAIFYMRVAV